MRGGTSRAKKCVDAARFFNGTCSVSRSSLSASYSTMKRSLPTVSRYAPSKLGSKNSPAFEALRV